MDGLPKVPGVSHRRVRAGHIEMHVAEAGEGPPLVLVHGWPQHWFCWRKLIPTLAGRYRVICPDLRGLGWTDVPSAGYEKETLADDLLNLLDAMDLRQVRYVGHDWGGYAGYLLALRAPERIERLALLDIVTPGRARARISPLAPLLMSYQVALATPVAGALGLSLTSEATVRIAQAWSERKLTREEADVYAARLREPERARASALYYRTFLMREMLQAGRYAKRRPLMPVLKLMGEQDFLRRVVHDEPDWKIVPGSGHFLPEEQPRALLRELEPFLEDEEPRGRGSSQSRSKASRSPGR